jgi:RNA polymerase sigma-70 factor (ECF subfamily)
VTVDLASAAGRRGTGLARSMPDGTAGPGDQVEGSVEGQRVLQAIGQLRPSHRLVLVEMYYRRKTSAELAVELALSEGTVRSRLFYALKSLRLQLGEGGWDP